MTDLKMREISGPPFHPAHYPGGRLAITVIIEELLKRFINFDIRILSCAC
jgi:hypothetical protein